MLKRIFGPRDPAERVAAQVAALRAAHHRNAATQEGLLNIPGYQKAFSALVAMGSPAVPSLVELLLQPRPDLDSMEQGLAEDAAEILGKIGDPQAVPALRQVLGEPLTHVPIALAATPEGVRELLAATTDADDHIRSRAAKGLGWASVERPAVLAALGRLLADPSPHVRHSAAGTTRLLDVPDPDLLRALGDLAAGDPEEWVQRAAANSLTALGR